jgi:hypothetical protein
MGAWIGVLKQRAITIAAPALCHSKQSESVGSRFARKNAGDHGAAGMKGMDHAATSCRANATSTESPSWFRTSSPDSGTSPDVLCDTMIFRAINPRQVICEELA